MATSEEIRGWVAGRVPSGWFESAPEVMVDREEILVVGGLRDVQLGKEGGAAEFSAARSGRIRQHREDTREERMRIAREAQQRFGRTVSWGARCGDVTELFTTISVPVMTRLHIAERQLLDALIEAGVARSRSHALAWCVRLVGKHQGEWLKELREAVAQLGRVRSANPLN